MKKMMPSDASELTPLAIWVALLVVGSGVLIRIASYALNRSIWMDEAFLSLNVINRSFFELTQPLSHHQGAPIGFLLIQKSVTLIFGIGEYAMRLFPCIAGIVSLLLMYHIARHSLGGAGMLVALVMFALNERLTYYAAQSKQYSSDVLITLFLLFAAYRYLGQAGFAQRYILLIVGGMAAIWLSHPALFVLAGIGVVLVLDYLVKPERQRLMWNVITLLAWGLNFAIIYLISLRKLASNDTLLDYWRSFFMPMQIEQAPAWLSQAFFAMFKDLVGLDHQPFVGIGLALFLLGCMSLMIRSWRQGLILILPFLIALLASGLEKYPFGERLSLFLIPLALLLISEAIERIDTLIRSRSSWLASGLSLIIASALVYPFFPQAYQMLTKPDMGDHIRPSLEYMRDNEIESDRIYVYYGAYPSFLYYSHIYKTDESHYHVGVAARQEPAKYIEDIDTLSWHGRVWFIFSHTCNWCAADEEPFYLQHLDTIATRLDEFHSPGASVYLYDLK